MAELKIEKIEDAIELLGLCGYPVTKAKWVTSGGGSLRDFETDDELIEFAENMRKSIDKSIEGMFGSEEQFTETMEAAGLLPKDDMKPLKWGGTSRARCGLCTNHLPNVHRCSEGVRKPIFYNTPTFGCEKFDDNGEDIV